MNQFLLSFAQRLHRFKLLRTLAKSLAAGRAVTQTFHGGEICLDAVEHAWAWTGNRPLENFDRFLQDRLVLLSDSRPHLIDIGCNLGVMTLAVLLRNPRSTSDSFDPNPRAIELLRASARRNHLTNRCALHQIAVSGGVRRLAFDPGGSFTGHVSSAGREVVALPLAELVQTHVRGPSVLKIDIEGYETELIDHLSRLPALPGSALVLELHPHGFNGIGDPVKVVEALRRRGDLQLEFIDGGDVAQFDPTQFRHLQALWCRA